MASAKNKPNEVAVVEHKLPTQYDYSQFAGAGFEDHTKEDYAVPFLGVLQSNSPQIENIPEARPGMLVNTVTNELFDPKVGVAFVPAHTQHVYVEWVPRDEGGGFVAVHELGSDIVKKVISEQEFGKYKMVKGNPKSNDLIETYYIYGILVHPDGNSEQIIIAFTSTKNKIYKQWMTKARTIQVPLPNGNRITAPIFAHRYRVTTIPQKNKKGSYYNFQVNFDGKNAEDARLSPVDPIFLQAVAFRDMIGQGGVKAAHETQGPGNASSPAEEEDIPFA